MGVMNKLRDSTGAILWILIIAFGVIWVLQDAGTFDVVGNTQGTNIILVDGDPITYEEYAQALDAQMQAYQQQTGETMPPQMADMERDRVFNALVENRLREREMDRLGIAVTDQEVYDLIMGDDPHPVIRTYFGDGQGGINRPLLQNFFSDPETRPQQLEVEAFVRRARREEKLNNLIAATVRVTDQDVIEEYERQNKTVDARYVALRYATIPDDSVQVTEQDVRAYYNEHRDDFERPRTYEISYAALSKQPTAADTALVVNELSGLRSRFAAAQDDSLFLAQNASQTPYTGGYFRVDELAPAVAAAVFANPEAGRVVGPVVAGDRAHLIKIQDVRAADQPAIQARHILFSAPEEDAAARAAARQQAQDVLQELQQGGDFAALARQHSSDPGSAAQGGDLGWFTRGRMVEPFENAAFGASVGQVVGPVETQFGYHLIEVTERAEREVQIADYTLSIATDVGTLNDLQERLDDLQYYTTESGDFAGEAQRLGLQTQTMRVTEDQQFIPGLGASRALMNFLADADEGDVSEVIELNDQFLVASVTDILPAGHRPFAEVQAELEPRVRLEKKRGLITSRLQRALSQAGGFDGLAGAVGTSEQVATALTISTPNVPGLGREPKFVGTAFGLGANQASGVVAGESAAYVLKVTDVKEAGTPSDTEREQIRQQLLSQRRNQVVNRWISDLRDEAEVEDYRRRFEQ